MLQHFVIGMYELNSCILEFTANKSVGLAPRQATCRPWESSLQGRAQPELLAFGFLSAQRVDCRGASKGN